MKHQLFQIESGTLLFRLGHSEFIVSPGEWLWIPWQCLNTVTLLPGTHAVCVEFSPRLNDIFPSQPGYVLPSDLCQLLVQRLKNCSRDTDIFLHLTAVLKDEVLRFHPTLPESRDSQRILIWHPDKTAQQNHMLPEMHVALLAREGQKMKLSGMQPDMIAQKLFRGDLDRYQYIRQSILGEPENS